MLKSDQNNVYIPLSGIKVQAWWLLHRTTHTFLIPIFFIKGSCFQNVSLFWFHLMSAILFFEEKKIQVLSFYSQRLHMHHSLILLGVNSFVINQTSKGDNNISLTGHFSLIYFFINLTFVMCNRPQATCSRI